MSIKLKGSTDGSVTLQAPADTSPTGTDKTFTLPTQDGEAGQILKTDGSGALSFTDNLSSNRNLVINGAMQVAQRGTVVNAGNEFAGPDRYKFRKNDGAYTISQDSDVPSGQGFGSSWKADVTAVPSGGSNSYLFLNYRIEGQDLQHLKKGTSSSESLTLSFWIKSSVTGTYIAEIYDNHNNRQISKSYTVSTADTWEHKTLTFPGDTSGTITNNNTASLELNFWFYAGSQFSSGTLNTSWAASTDANRVVGQVNAANNTANNIYLTGVQLEVGSVATKFEHRSYGDELQRCFRYTQAYGSGRIALGIWNDNTGGDRAVVLQHLHTEMRATPTLEASTNGRLVVEGSAWYDVTSTPTLTGESTNRVVMYNLHTSTNVSQITADGLVPTAWGNGASVILSAEL